MWHGGRGYRRRSRHRSWCPDVSPGCHYRSSVPPTHLRTAVIALLSLTVLAAACTDGDDGAAVSTTAAATTSSTTEPSTTTPSSETTDDAEPPPTTADDPVELEWVECDGLECATLEVPLDYDEPDGDTIEIEMIRQPAPDPARRIGSIFFNPGGPGGSGLEYLRIAVLTLPAEIGQRFDLVSFDPRGVGDSTAFDCDLDVDDSTVLLEEGDDAGWEALLATNEQLLAGCPDEATAITPYLGTNNAARDLDRMRAAVGDEGLTYVGFSYGTRLGATYAELFPSNVRALVLDAAVLPSSDLFELGREQAAGFDRAFENFAAACDADPDCPLQELGPTFEVFRAVEAEIREVGSFTTEDPERMLTPSEFYGGILASLYSVASWPLLAEGLFTAETLADGTILQLLGDSLTGRQPDGSYSNINEANLAINCADDPARPDPDEVRRVVADAASSTEYFADALRAGTGCLFVADPIDPLVIGPAVGAPPIVVIGNTGDPATPYEWSEALADQLDSAVLFTVEAEGHTAYGTFDCVTGPINAYLIDLEVPADGASCSENATADFFLPAGESDIDLVLAFFACLQDEGLEFEDVTLTTLLADPTGEGLFDDIDLEDEATLVAVFACQEFLPDL